MIFFLVETFIKPPLEGWGILHSGVEAVQYSRTHCTLGPYQPPDGTMSHKAISKKQKSRTLPPVRRPRIKDVRQVKLG